jgi:HD-like signal output (HDOD) protein
MSVGVEIALRALESEDARRHLTLALSTPQSIAPLPRVCAQLAELTARQVTDAAQLAKLIQSDPALAGEIMRVANSPALRARAPIVSLQQAVSWLGIAEVRNIAMAVMLRGEVFKAPGHEQTSEALWREAWVSGLWAKEIARERRKHVESAFLAALMHRTGAALALKILSRFEADEHRSLESPEFAALTAEFEPAFGRLLMQSWRLPEDVQHGASEWREYRASAHGDLAGTVHAAHLCAVHTLHPESLTEEMLIDDAVFEQLNVFPDDRRALLAKREHVLSLAGG